MKDDVEIDVLVVGAGPTGLAMAAELLRHGMRVRLIDKAGGPTRLSKAVVLMPRTLEEFQLRGLHERTLALGEKVHSFSAYFENEIIFHAEYARISSNFNYLLNIPQCDTELVLREELERLGGVIEWGTVLESFEESADGVQCVVRDSDGGMVEVRCAYLAGCDGAHSVVRHGIGAEFHGDSYRDTWLLADVKVEWDFPSGHTYSFFCNDGLLAMFSMPGGRHRLYVVRPEAQTLGREPEFADIVSAVEQIAPGKMKLSEPEWLAEFHCHHRKVKHYRKGRVFLAGDAAHIHSPESGLGMNTGVQDAFNLGWKLAAVHRGECPAELLETYDAERSFVGKQVVALSDFTHKMSVQFNMLGNLTRSALWRFFSSYYVHHYSRLEEGFQVRIHYPGNRFLEHHGHPQGFRPDLPEVVSGARLLDGELVVPGGGEIVRLYDRLGARYFTLIIMAGPHPDAHHRAAIWSLAELLAGFGEKCRSMLILGRQHADGFEAFPGEVLLDVNQFLHHRYGADRGSIYLARPDSYVAFSEHALKTDRITQFMKRLFC